MSRSRKQRRLEKGLKKNLILSILGMLLVLFVLIKFGIPLLVNFSLLFSKQTDSVSTQKDKNLFLNTPILDTLPIATNSAKIIVTGVSSADVSVILYVNDKRIEETDVNKKGEFSFEYLLSKGNNKIYVRSQKENEKSDISEIANVVFDDTPPPLSINSPSDGQSFSKDQNSANVTGTTEEEARVTINGFWAIVNEDNSFSYSLPLQNGENTIKVVSTDLAGNKSEKEIKVNYSP